MTYIRSPQVRLRCGIESLGGRAEAYRIAAGRTWADRNEVGRIAAAAAVVADSAVAVAGEADVAAVAAEEGVASLRFGQVSICADVCEFPVLRRGAWGRIECFRIDVGQKTYGLWFGESGEFRLAFLDFSSVVGCDVISIMDLQYCDAKRGAPRTWRGRGGLDVNGRDGGNLNLPRESIRVVGSVIRHVGDDVACDGRRTNVRIVYIVEIAFVFRNDSRGSCRERGGGGRRKGRW